MIVTFVLVHHLFPWKLLEVNTLLIDNFYYGVKDKR